MKRILQIVLVVTALLAGLESVWAQDNRDYYWVQDSGNWYDLTKWQVLGDDGTFAAATELPDATNRVFINGALAPSGGAATTPLAITGSLVPNTVDITIAAPVGDPGAGPVAVKSISFGGTIAAGTLVNFTVGQPLTIAENLTADYPVVIRVGNDLAVHGGVILNAGGSNLAIDATTTVTGAVTLNAAATITANGPLQAGSLAINAAASVAVGAAGSLQMGALAFGTGATGASLMADGPVTVTGAVNVNAQTTIAANNTFSASSVTYHAAASNATLTLGQAANITNAFLVNAPATITANGTLQANSVTINAAATVNVGPAGGLQTGTLTYGTSATNATLTAHGPVSVTGALNVNALTTITANHNFSTGSLNYSSTSGVSRLTLGNPATANTTASLGTVTVNAPAIITANNATNTTLSMASATFALPAPLPAATPQLLINRPTTVAGAVTVNSPAAITTTSAFTAGSMAFATTAGASSLSISGQATTISGNLSVASNATITAGSLLDVKGLMTVNANAPVTINGNGELRANALTYGTGATGATLLANGPVSVTGALTVEALTTITANRNFSAGSILYTNTAGASTLTFGNPAQANTAATIAGAVTINSPAVITANNATNTSLSMGSLTFGANASLTLNRPTVIAGAVAYNANATMTVNNSLSIGGDLTFATGMTTGAIVINGPVSLRGSLRLAGPNNLTGNVTTGSLTFTFTPTPAAAYATIHSAGTLYRIPVTFNGTAGIWKLTDHFRTMGHVQFRRGHVVALPQPITQSVDPNFNLLTTPTEASTSGVTGTPKFVFVDTLSTRATVSGASVASHVVGYVEKKVVKDSPEFEFPVGSGGYYRPLFTAVAPSANTLLARYFSTNPAKPISNTSTIINGVSTTWSRVDVTMPLSSVSDREFWYFNAADNSSPAITMNATHPDPAIAKHYRLDKWPGLTLAGMGTSSARPPVATWKDLNATSPKQAVKAVLDPATGITNYMVTAHGSTSNSGVWFTFGRRDQSPLPVRLVSFSAQYVDGQVQLKWQSAEEKNTSHFEIEKSGDGKNFAALLTKKAQGNSAALVSYQALDNSPLSGTSYYRLKMVDLDGTFEYSKMVAVSAESELLVRAYPNPCQGNSIHFVAGNGSKLVLKSVSDLFGKQVGYRAAHAAEGLQVSFPQSLPAGFYVATLAGVGNGQLVQVKFIVQ